MKGLASTGGDNAWTSSVLPVNTWTHVAITYSLSDGEIRQYINGEPDATHKFNGNAKIRFDRALRLGVQWNNHNKFNGQLDDLLIYADALTPLEIRQIYEGTVLECQETTSSRYPATGCLPMDSSTTSSETKCYCV